MRTLLLMRHAKSDWSSDIPNDQDRPLNTRGRRDAPLIGTYLAQNDLTPQIAMISDAERTQETWSLMEPSLPNTDASFYADLYLAEPLKMLSRLQGVSDDIQSVLLLAHQPGMSILTKLLTRGVPDANLTAAYSHFPTAAVAVMQFGCDSWAQLEGSTCEFVNFVRPKNLL
jgi:phosphohistidine phosphatase